MISAYLNHSSHILRRKKKCQKKEISFTEGPVFQSLLRFAIPVLGALILQAAYGAVDLLIVGKIRKCLEYFRSRNRKFLYADGYFLLLQALQWAPP